MTQDTKRSFDEVVAVTNTIINALQEHHPNITPRQLIVALGMLLGKTLNTLPAISRLKVVDGLVEALRQSTSVRF